jgi:hypothetical protein
MLYSALNTSIVVSPQYITGEVSTYQIPLLSFNVIIVRRRTIENDYIPSGDSTRHCKGAVACLTF